MSALATAKKAAPFFAHFVLALVVMVGAEILGYGVPSIADGWRAYLVGMFPILAAMLGLALAFRAIAAVVRNHAQLQRPLMALLGIGVCLAASAGMILAMLASGWLFLFAFAVLTGADYWQYRGAGDILILFFYGLPGAAVLMALLGTGALWNFWEFLVDVGADAFEAIAKRRGKA